MNAEERWNSLYHYPDRWRLLTAAGVSDMSWENASWDELSLEIRTRLTIVLDSCANAHAPVAGKGSSD